MKMKGLGSIGLIAVLVLMAGAPATFAQNASGGVGLGNNVLPRVLPKVSQAGDPIDPSDFADNLGNHTATRNLIMGGHNITGAGDVAASTISIGSGTISNRLTAGAIQSPGIDAANGRIIRVANPTANTDAVNYRTLIDAVNNGGDDLGNHIATRTIVMDGNRIHFGTITGYNAAGNPILGPGIIVEDATISGLAAPTANTHAANKKYVDDAVGGVPVRTYSAGDGLSLSGSTFAVNSSVVRTSRAISVGTGLSGGGNLSANRTISLAANQIRRGVTDTAAGVLPYNGQARTAGQFYGGTGNPVTTNRRINFDGELRATRMYSTAYYYFSDERLKKDIVGLDKVEGLDQVMKLRPVSYAWKKDGEKALGFIAQEVEEILPTAVRTGDDGIKAIDYQQIIAPLIASVQNLEARISELESEK